MSQSDLEDRLDAVERALTDGETDLTDVRDRAALSAAVDRLETRVADLEATVEELDASVEAVRGYAGNVRAVNRDVERRASAALAKVEALETSVDGTHDGPVHQETDADRSAGTASGTETGPTATPRAGHRNESGPRNERTPVTGSRDTGTARKAGADGTGIGGTEADGIGTDGTGGTRDSDETAESGDPDDTEQFIERIRDAL